MSPVLSASVSLEAGLKDWSSASLASCNSSNSSLPSNLAAWETTCKKKNKKIVTHDGVTRFQFLKQFDNPGMPHLHQLYVFLWVLDSCRG